MKLPMTYSTKSMTCTLSEMKDYYVMIGTKTGTHKLHIDNTNQKRLMAHWIGFITNNMTEAECYFFHMDNSEIERADRLLSSSDVSYIDGRNEIGFYSIEVYTFTDGSKIGFLGGHDADYLDNILNELGHYKQ